MCEEGRCGDTVFDLSHLEPEPNYSIYIADILNIIFVCSFNFVNKYLNQKQQHGMDIEFIFWDHNG